MKTVASPLLTSPLIGLDEYAKASSDVQQAVFAYIAGASYRVEGATLDVTATAIVTMNVEADAARAFPEDYLRRSVALDTTRLDTRNIDVVAAELAHATLPVVSPDLRPPAPAIPDNARAGLRHLLMDCLTEPGWRLVNVEAVTRLVLGRWATAPDNLEAALVAVAADYLLVTGTRLDSSTKQRLVRTAWPSLFKAIVGRAGGPVDPVLAAALSQLAAQTEQKATAERSALSEEVALAAEREALLARIDHARDTAPRGADLTATDRDTKARAFGAARLLRRKVSEARDRPALAELAIPVEDTVLAPLRAAGAAVEARRQATVQARVQRRQRELERHRQAVAQAKAAGQAASVARAAAKKRDALVQKLRGRTSTRTGEGVLDSLVSAECLRWQSEQYQAEPLGSRVARGVDRVRSALQGPTAAPPVQPSSLPVWVAPQAAAPVSSERAPVYETRTRWWCVDLAGRKWRPEDLVAWGTPAVNQVLDAAAAAFRLPLVTRKPTPRISPRRTRSPGP